MLGNDDAGFADIQATALNAAMSGSIFAVPEACFVMTMALPFGLTRAVATAQDISPRPPCHSDPSASLRSVVLIAALSFEPSEVPGNGALAALIVERGLRSFLSISYFAAPI
jgi:hypothetical protein